jgi:hypothetical protein
MQGTRKPGFLAVKPGETGVNRCGGDVGRIGLATKDTKEHEV